MNIENMMNDIAKKLTLITCYVRFKTSANLNDINTLLETSFKEILNIIFDYNLVNLNSDYLYPAIDLGDVENRISFQITSTNDSSKISKTIKKFRENELDKDYDKLRFLIIDEKKAYRPKVSLDTEYFSLKNDVISVFELTKYIKDLNIEKKEQIIKILDNTIGNYNIDINSNIESNEVNTIISIIQLLSNESCDEEILNDSIPNPNYKINERFKEYKDYLNDMYVDLSSIYATTYIKIQTTQAIGTTQIKKISAYLRKISKRKLIDYNGDLMLAYDSIVNMLEDKLKNYSNINFDKNAIEYFVIKNIVDCNVFPNE